MPNTLQVAVEGGLVGREYVTGGDEGDETVEAVGEALRHFATGQYDVVTLVVGWTPEVDRQADWDAFVARLRAGEKDAVDEAVVLLRTHALPEEHPAALD